MELTIPHFAAEREIQSVIVRENSDPSLNPEFIIYDQPSDSVVLKGGGYFNSRDTFLGLPRSVKLNQYRLDEEEMREFFAEMVK